MVADVGRLAVPAGRFFVKISAAAATVLCATAGFFVGGVVAVAAARPDCFRFGAAFLATNDAFNDDLSRGCGLGLRCCGRITGLADRKSVV